MLTRLETKTAFRIYNICCKSFSVPFEFKNGRLIKSNSSRLVLIKVLLTLGFRIYQIQFKTWKEDLNASIFRGLFLIVTVAHLVLKLNIWVYQDELPELINQVVQLNDRWGK